MTSTLFNNLIDLGGVSFQLPIASYDDWRANINIDRPILWESHQRQILPIRHFVCCLYSGGSQISFMRDTYLKNIYTQMLADQQRQQQIRLYFLFLCIITGEYSCLKVDLLFRREFSYYLITIYIPCCMLVIVSWVSFWLDANAVPARVSLGVTTLLTMATQTTGINNSLPPVSYTKVRTSFIFICAAFTFDYRNVSLYA